MEHLSGTFEGENFSSDPTNLTGFIGKLFFSASDPTNGIELWSSDGTTLVKDINPEFYSSQPSNLTGVDGTLIFSAFNYTRGHEVWSSDGTSIGTYVAEELVPGSGSSGPNSLIAINGELYYFASSGLGGAGSLRKGDFEPPGVPVGLTATRNSQNSVDLKWDAGREDTHYEVWRGTSPSNMVLIANTTSRSFQDSSAKSGTDYSYQVIAVCPHGRNPSVHLVGKRWGKADMMVQVSGKRVIGKNRYKTYSGQTAKFTGTQRNAVGFVMYVKNASLTGKERFRSYGKRGSAFLGVTYYSATHKQNVAAKLNTGRLERVIDARHLEKITVRIKPTARGLNRRCSVSLPLSTKFLQYPTARDIGKIILIKKR